MKASNKEDVVEIKSNIFIPKYLFTTHLKPLVYGVGFIVVGFVVFQRGWYSWEYVFVLALLGLNAVQEARRIIKEIEFGESEMIIRYVFWAEKAVAYHGVRNIDVNLSIGFDDVVISLKGMTNAMDLQKIIADILRKKKIRDINIETEIEKRSKVGRKIFGYAFIFTFVIGVVATSFVRADLGTWAFLLFFLFVIVVLVLSIFIKA